MNIIGITYKNFLKPILFKQDPEDVHDRLLLFGGFLGKYRILRSITSGLLRYSNPKLEQTVLGIKFSNPVGLSAGFDKDANLTQILPDVGFGFMQIGSVTLYPYKGNPKPRLYRLPKSKALVVYYGLKNIGVEKIITKLKSLRKQRFPISISVAKTNSKDTSTTEQGIEDYFGCLKKLHEENVGDFYTINISCPNTFGGEPFTTPDKLEKLLGKFNDLNISKPMFIKMPINLRWEEFDQLLKVIEEHRIEGVVIGNLLKNHNSDDIKDEIPKHVKGGISGLPTQEICNNLISKTYQKYRDKLTIIGVGGIFNAEDAYQKIKLGSSLVQLVTGAIYEGPQVVGELNKGLVELLENDGYQNISEAIGSNHNNKVSA